tara:strand:- start:541 stop:975 length:435 start_codon:yes stop_codon:yes gene_type:complete
MKVIFQGVEYKVYSKYLANRRYISCNGKLHSFSDYHKSKKVDEIVEYDFIYILVGKCLNIFKNDKLIGVIPFEEHQDCCGESIIGDPDQIIWLGAVEDFKKSMKIFIAETNLTAIGTESDRTSELLVSMGFKLIYKNYYSMYLG